MTEPHADRPRRIMFGADKGAEPALGLDPRGAKDFVSELRSLYVAAKTRRSAVDGRTTRHAGFRTSRIVRKRIEEAFGWVKATAGFRKTRHGGLGRVGWQFTLTMAAYNLIRLPNLLAQAA